MRKTLKGRKTKDENSERPCPPWRVRRDRPAQKPVSRGVSLFRVSFFAGFAMFRLSPSRQTLQQRLYEGLA
jgi:hypothetical protein